ncbi:hypothetical protein LEN26_012481 [Aphanomyces euteiches]|nr:hypothetical protein LEN26_012481 [Aphanomyces euteiches]KAH9127779.1 hypothetical protein AeMF1_001972 [Aphanomyces euteiches]KAH9188342.1 hypothetical protein AeNC1_009683 [Aphanomyces euteiches]
MTYLAKLNGISATVLGVALAPICNQGIVLQALGRIRGAVVSRRLGLADKDSRKTLLVDRKTCAATDPEDHPDVAMIQQHRDLDHVLQPVN